MDQEKIGKFIAQLRKEKKMTQESLAKHLYTDRTIVSKWERGLYIPKHDIILKLSQLFDVSVNEIYYGARENESNKSQVSEVTIDIIKSSNKKIKRIIISSCLIIISMIIAFFTYYFINNYKSISVYTITGNENNIDVNGILVISNEEMYIQFESIDNLNFDDVKKIGLYYDKYDEKKIVIEDSSKLKLYINKFGIDEDIPYKDFKYIRNKLWIEISYKNDETHNIKLNLQRIFTNNNIFSKKLGNTSEKEIIKFNDSIPEYIKNNFKFNEEEECYYRKTKKEDLKVNEMYYYNANLYVVEEIYEDYTERFEYISPGWISYSKINDEKETEFFDYSIDNNECSIGDCNIKKVEYFEHNYLKKEYFEIGK